MPTRKTKRKYKKRFLNVDYLRNIIFGAEDSLVSTVGVLFGLASSNEYNSTQLILAGIVLIAVEALSMGVGSYLTETEVHEFEGKSDHGDSTIVDGVIMLFSYAIFGCAVLFPYTILEQGLAKYISVYITLFLLFAVGYLPTRKFANGTRMMFVAGMAILVGFLVAKIF